MVKKVVPMIHVPDVRATVAWYADLGFIVNGTHEEDDGEIELGIRLVWRERADVQRRRPPEHG